ncbi:DUF3784 domain-containing protein [Clostridium sp.]|jgi:hypothetical protein|uniref:DUF3784 domain-containing protein n=1 Tax=Clostridium sp. TaxID=1506 RepID=UPI003EE8AA84
MKISIFIMPAILIIIGAFIRTGKGSFLIAGYNTSTKQQKEKYDEVALCKFVSNILFFIAVITFIYLIGRTYDITFIRILAMATLIITVIRASMYANTGNKFLKKK